MAHVTLHRFRLWNEGTVRYCGWIWGVLMANDVRMKYGAYADADDLPVATKPPTMSSTITRLTTQFDSENMVLRRVGDLGPSVTIRRLID